MTKGTEHIESESEEREPNDKIKLDEIFKKRYEEAYH